MMTSLSRNELHLISLSLDRVTPETPLATYCQGSNVWVSVSVVVDKLALLLFGIRVVDDL